MTGPAYIQFRGRRDKLERVGTAFSRFLSEDVLDVGCDATHLSRFVGGRYRGVDISGSPDVVSDVERGLPFLDQRFDTVAAFDVLEHCEPIHFVFDELCRVARRHVIVGLPNMFEWRFRLRYLVGRSPSAKYGLPPHAPGDRHRWLFGLREAQRFVVARAAANGFDLAEEVFARYEYRRVVPRVLMSAARFVGRSGDPLFVYHYCAALERQRGSSARSDPPAG